MFIYSVEMPAELDSCGITFILDLAMLASRLDIALFPCQNYHQSHLNGIF